MKSNIIRLKKAIKNFKNRSILVVGDIMLDQYTYGDVTRISPEAPVPVLLQTGDEFMPGGAANTAYNLASFGAKAKLVGIVGSDHVGKILFRLLKAKGVDVGSILIRNKKSTILKHRFARGNQHLLRVDYEDAPSLSKKEEEKLFYFIKKEIKECDGVLLSDYAKGVFSKNLTQKIIKESRKYRKKIVADIKPKNKEFFKGINILTPNLKEALEMTGIDDLYKTGQELVNFYKADIVITKGGEGSTIFKKNGKYINLPGEKVKVIDVSGAGDTAVSVLILGILSGLNIEEAGELANHAGGIAVQKRGTSTLTLEELNSALGEDYHLEKVDIIPKIWGYEKWLENNDKYCCKLLSLKKGYQCSLHYHNKKDEMFFVTKGHVRLEVNGKVTHMREGNYMRITPGTKHRFRGMEDSIIIEVSTHHEESDSYRIEESRRVKDTAI